MSRSWSLVAGIVVVWTIAVAGAALMGSLPYWRALRFGVANEWVAGVAAVLFLGTFAWLGTWAFRTSLSLITEDRQDGGSLRRQWPDVPRSAELRARGLIDRRGRPGQLATVASDIVANLRGGERSDRELAIVASMEVWLAVAGDSAIVRLLDVDHRELASVRDGDPPRQLFVGPGTYRVVIGREDSASHAPAEVWAWWIGTKSGA